jgi:peptidyl-prolyl cis-trans isomerase C
MRTLIAAATLALTLGLAQAQDANRVVATVNGETITEADVTLALEDLQTQVPNLPPDRQRQVALDFLVEVKLAAQAAKGEKFDESDDFKRKMAYARERILMERLLARAGEKASGEAAVKAYYDEQVKLLKPTEEVRARHILVEGEDDAKKVAARIKAGEDFAKIAIEASKDPGSGKEGGDLGFFTKEQMVAEFAEAAFALKPGEVSAPVKSQFGWHVIKLEERRTKPLPTFDSVKERLAQALANKAQGDMIADLRKKAKIEMTPAPEQKKP